MRFILLNVILVLFSVPILENSNEYDRVYSKNGINIYKHNSDESRRFKLSFKVKENVNNVYNQLKNPENYNAWLGSMVEIDKYSSISDNVVLSYVKVGIDNVFTRDGIIKTEFMEIPNSTSKVIKQRLVENHPKADNDYPPFKKFESNWDIRKLSKNTTKVELFIKGGTEGDSDILNSIIDKILTNRLYDLATEIKDI